MKTAPILIIDKLGTIGEPLSLKLSQEFTVVLVSRKLKNHFEQNKNISHIPFLKNLPAIPENKYSHIIVVHDDCLHLDFLSKIIEEARNVNANFIFALGLSSKEEYLIEKVLKMYVSSKIILYGDIFGSELIYQGEGFKSIVNKFIYQAQSFEQMQVLGDGLRETHPVFLNDVIEGIIGVVFGIHDPHSVFYIFPKTAITELSLAHMIQKNNPEVTIDFVKHAPQDNKISYPAHGKYLLDDNYPLAIKIRKIEIKKTIKTEYKNDCENHQKEKKSFPFFILWILIFLISFPFLFTLFFSFLGLSTLYHAKTKEAVQLSNTFLYIGKKASDILSVQGKIIGRKENLRNLLNDADFGYKSSNGLIMAINAGNYFAKVANGTSKDRLEDFAKGQNDLKNAIVLLEELRAENKIPVLFKEKIESIGPLIKLLSNIENVLPDIFGMDGEKKYLVLFQDSMELRPGGGAISSYGILKLNMGRIIDFSIHDVLSADKQLRGHLEPPYAIRRHLPSRHWYLKDSNFDVDFVRSASASSNFLYVETGEKVSGVIGADAVFAKNILSSGLSYFEKAQLIADSLMKKHLVIALNDNLQNVLNASGWSSTLWDERRESKEFINDFLGINEANLGGNKINSLIYRNISQEVMITGDGNISVALKISYKNDSASLSGGEYKNYLRIILPLNAALSEISINGIAQSIIDAVTDPLIYEAKNFKIPEGLEVEKTIEGNKTVYGFVVKVPAEEIVRIRVKYSLAEKISTDQNTFSYNLKLLKQPGVDSIPYSFSLSYPAGFSVVNASDGIISDNGKVTRSRRITGDENLIINFAKN